MKQASNKKGFVLYTNPFSNLGEQRELSMDWSVNTPTTSSSLSYIPPAGEHVPSLYVSLPQCSIDGSNVSGPFNSGVEVTVLNYSNNQPTDPNL